MTERTREHGWAQPGGKRSAHRLIRMRRLQLAILPVLFVLGVLIAAQSYRSIDEELTASATSRRASLSYLAAITLTEKLDRVVDLGVSFATRLRFRDLVAQGNWAEAAKIMTIVRRDFPDIDRIILSDLSGKLMADVPEVPELHGRDFSFRDWYKGVSAGWQPYVSEVYRRAAVPQIDVVAAAIPIKSQAGDNVGILVMQLRLETFFAWLKEIDLGPNGQLYVVDRKGTLAFYPGLPPQGEPVSLAEFPLVQKMLAGERGVEVAKDPLNGADNLVAYERMPKYGWGVVAEQPVETAFAARDAQLRRIVIAYGLIAIVSLLAMYLGVRFIDQQRRAAEDAEAKAELERRVAERTAELQHSNQELESFSYSVSHDLRAPLRAIDGFAAILDEDHRDTIGSAGRQHLATIRKNTQRMAQLIDDLLAFARLGRTPIAAKTIDMEALVRDVIADLRSHLPGADRAEIALRALPSAEGDLALLRQVWANLLSNALKFSSGAERPRIEMGGEVIGDQCRYYVRDNGAGFDMAYDAKLFGVFERLHGADEFPGSGVGLAIVKRIITRHGGSVSAEGAVGGGARFCFTLPRSQVSVTRDQ